MSRIPENKVSVEGLRRRSVGPNPKSSDHQARQSATKEEVVVESPSEDMDDLASVELGRKPSVSSNGSLASDQEEDHMSEEEPRCDEALLKYEEEVRIEDEQSSSDSINQQKQDSGDEISQNEASSQETAEYKDSVEDQKLSDNDEEKENVSQSSRESREEETAVDSENKKDVQDGKDDEEEELSDEEAETRLPLQVKVITARASVDGRVSDFKVFAMFVTIFLFVVVLSVLYFLYCT